MPFAKLPPLSPHPNVLMESPTTVPDHLISVGYINTHDGVVCMIETCIVEASVRHQLYMCLIRSIKVLFIAIFASASSHNIDCNS